MISNLDAFLNRFKERIHGDSGPLVERLCAKCMERVVKDLNRIADARLLEGSLKGKLIFTYNRVEATVYTVTPSDPILFKKIEWGEFNEDGSLKTPPHSILQELKVYVRI